MFYGDFDCFTAILCCVCVLSYSGTLCWLNLLEKSNLCSGQYLEYPVKQLISDCSVCFVSMSFDLETFVSRPSHEEVAQLNKADLVQLANHYKLSITSSSKKGEVKQLVLSHLEDEELISDDEGSGNSSEANAIELKRLKFQENERERENALRIEELELREKELVIQLKLKELEVSSSSATLVTPSSGRHATFDISKQIHFVPVFQEREVDTYFLNFEKVATSLEWPKDVWALLLQSVLIGKAREIYTALTVEQSSQYEVVKGSVLKAYELVPEAYRQRFRSSRKGDVQTYVEFGRDKETLFDQWYASKGVKDDFSKLRQLMLIEEFKNCLPSDIKTYLDEQMVENLHQAAV